MNFMQGRFTDFVSFPRQPRQKPGAESPLKSYTRLASNGVNGCSSWPWCSLLCPLSTSVGASVGARESHRVVQWLLLSLSSDPTSRHLQLWVSLRASEQSRQCQVKWPCAPAPLHSPEQLGSEPGSREKLASRVFNSSSNRFRSTWAARQSCPEMFYGDNIFILRGKEVTFPPWLKG